MGDVTRERGTEHPGPRDSPFEGPIQAPPAAERPAISPSSETTGVVGREPTQDEFRILVDSIPQLAWMADHTGWIFWYNRRWYDYTGTTLQEMQGWGWRSVHHPDHVDRVVQRIQRSWDTGEPWEDTFPLRGCDGTYRWFLSRALPVRDAEGRVVLWFGTNTDITRQLETETELRESEARFRNMADHAPVMLRVTDLHGDCTFLNSRWYEFTGQTPEAGMSLGWMQAVHPDDRALVDRLFRQARETNASFRMDYRLRTAAHTYRMVVDAAAPRVGPNGEFLGFISSIIDVEERARLLAAERAARREAEDARQRADEANAAKAQFLTTMSHELRTPLNAIAGYAQLLELGVHGPVTEAQLQALGRIRRSQEHLLGLINSVLNYAKLEAGKVEYELTTVSVPAMLDSVEQLVAAQARSRRLTLERRTCATSLDVRADADKLRQVLLNLLSNALKFTPAGGTITLGCRPERDNAVALYVSDTGRGIPREQLPRIFDPFVQVGRRLTSTDEGTGLGLAISRDLAAGMGGELTAESTEGVGSTFTLVLPLVRIGS